MTNLLIHVDLGNYNDKEDYLYTSAKYDAPRLFYHPNYYFLPKWAPEPIYLNGLLSPFT